MIPVVAAPFANAIQIQATTPVLHVLLHIIRRDALAPPGVLQIFQELVEKPRLLGAEGYLKKHVDKEIKQFGFKDSMFEINLREAFAWCPESKNRYFLEID